MIIPYLAGGNASAICLKTLIMHSAGVPERPAPLSLLVCFLHSDAQYKCYYYKYVHLVESERKYMHFVESERKYMHFVESECKYMHFVESDRKSVV